MSTGSDIAAAEALPAGITDAREPAVVLDAADWRHDFESWRWLKVADGAVPAGFADPGFDDGEWSRIPVLHAIYDARYAGEALFRQRFTLPEALRGRPVSLVLGGMDDEDWEHYALHLNGSPLDRWAPSGRWRTPHRTVLAPGEPAYEALRWGGENLIALRVGGLARPLPEGADPADAEHYFFQDWLFDQFVCVGEPYEVVGGRDGAIAAEVAYARGADGHLRKHVTLENVGEAPRRVLDVVLADLSGDFGTVSRGGRGIPVLTRSLFAGGEHPSVVNQGDHGSIRVLHLAGATLAPGERLACPPVVIGAVPPGTEPAAAFRDYVRGLRPRRDRRLTLYDTLGWTDYASELPERPNLNEALLAEVLRELARLRERGIAFDLFLLDDWFDPDDFLRFNPAHYPSGGRAVAERVHAAGMGTGLWSATTQASWSSHAVEGVEASIAGGVARTVGWERPPEDVASWDWDTVFAYVSTGQMRFCPASEPFRSLLRTSLETHVADTGAQALKLDCAVLHCTASDHGHAPGKYSVHAIHESMRELVAALREQAPALFVIWYWGFRSPWWLLDGDTLFDKGLKLEAASPASSPGPAWRPAVTLNADQAVRHAELIPLSLQDDLGTWIGNVPWANWMGTADWQDAIVMSLARGSTLLSLWGDLWLFDDHDREFLAALLAYARRHEPTFRDVVTVGGDPWRAEPYGYAQPRAGGAGTLLTVHNPSFTTATFPLPEGHREVVEIYPSPGRTGERGALTLAPWEIRLVELRDSTEGIPDRPASGARPARDLALFPAGEATLPELAAGDELVIWARVHRDGIWRYEPEPQSLLTLDLRIDGAPVAAETAPAIRSWNGPGCPWVTYRVPLDGFAAGQTVSARLELDPASGLGLERGALVFDGRAQRRKGTLRDVA